MNGTESALRIWPAEFALALHGDWKVRVFWYRLLTALRSPLVERAGAHTHTRFHQI